MSGFNLKVDFHTDASPSTSSRARTPSSSDGRRIFSNMSVQVDNLPTSAGPRTAPITPPVHLLSLSQSKTSSPGTSARTLVPPRSPSARLSTMDSLFGGAFHPPPASSAITPHGAATSTASGTATPAAAVGDATATTDAVHAPISNISLTPNKGSTAVPVADQIPSTPANTYEPSYDSDDSNEEFDPSSTKEIVGIKQPASAGSTTVDLQNEVQQLLIAVSANKSVPAVGLTPLVLSDSEEEGDQKASSQINISTSYTPTHKSPHPVPSMSFSANDTAKTSDISRATMSFLDSGRPPPGNLSVRSGADKKGAYARSGSFQGLNDPMPDMEDYSIGADEDGDTPRKRPVLTEEEMQKEMADTAAQLARAFPSALDEVTLRAIEAKDVSVLQDALGFEKEETFLHPDAIKEAKVQESPRLRFEKFDHRKQIDYRFQGDWTMDADDMKDMRKKLKYDPIILKWISVFWRTYITKKKEGVTRNEYLSVHMLMSKALHKLYNQREASILAARDWTRDQWHNPTNAFMDERTYIDSLFEAADIWTMTVDHGEYMHFLATLFHRITRLKTWISRTGKLTQKYVWRHLKDVKPSLVYRPYQYSKVQDGKFKPAIDVLHQLDAETDSDSDSDSSSTGSDSSDSSESGVGHALTADEEAKRANRSVRRSIDMMRAIMTQVPDVPTEPPEDGLVSPTGSMPPSPPTSEDEGDPDSMTIEELQRKTKEEEEKKSKAAHDHLVTPDLMRLRSKFSKAPSNAQSAQAAGRSRAKGPQSLFLAVVSEEEKQATALSNLAHVAMKAMHKTGKTIRTRLHERLRQTLQQAQAILKMRRLEKMRLAINRLKKIMEAGDFLQRPASVRDTRQSPRTLRLRAQHHDLSRRLSHFAKFTKLNLAGPTRITRRMSAPGQLQGNFGLAYDEGTEEAKHNKETHVGLVQPAFVSQEDHDKEITDEELDKFLQLAEQKKKQKLGIASGSGDGSGGVDGAGSVNDPFLGNNLNVKQNLIYRRRSTAMEDEAAAQALIQKLAEAIVRVEEEPVQHMTIHRHPTNQHGTTGAGDTDNAATSIAVTVSEPVPPAPDLTSLGSKPYRTAAAAKPVEVIELKRIGSDQPLEQKDEMDDLMAAWKREKEEEEARWRAIRDEEERFRIKEKAALEELRRQREQEELREQEERYRQETKDNEAAKAEAELFSLLADAERNRLAEREIRSQRHLAALAQKLHERRKEKERLKQEADAGVEGDDSGSEDENGVYRRRVPFNMQFSSSDEEDGDGKKKKKKHRKHRRRKGDESQEEDELEDKSGKPAKPGASAPKRDGKRGTMSPNFGARTLHPPSLKPNSRRASGKFTPKSGGASSDEEDQDDEEDAATPTASKKKGKAKAKGRKSRGGSAQTSDVSSEGEDGSAKSKGKEKGKGKRTVGGRKGQSAASPAHSDRDDEERGKSSPTRGRSVLRTRTHAAKDGDSAGSPAASSPAGSPGRKGGKRRLGKSGKGGASGENEDGPQLDGGDEVVESPEDANMSNKLNQLMSKLKNMRQQNDQRQQELDQKLGEVQLQAQKLRKKSRKMSLAAMDIGAALGAPSDQPKRHVRKKVVGPDGPVDGGEEEEDDYDTDEEQQDTVQALGQSGLKPIKWKKGSKRRTSGSASDSSMDSSFGAEYDKKKKQGSGGQWKSGVLKSKYPRHGDDNESADDDSSVSHSTFTETDTNFDDSMSVSTDFTQDTEALAHDEKLHRKVAGMMNAREKRTYLLMRAQQAQEMREERTKRMQEVSHKKQEKTMGNINEKKGRIQSLEAAQYAKEAKRHDIVKARLAEKREREEKERDRVLKIMDELAEKERLRFDELVENAAKRAAARMANEPDKNKRKQIAMEEAKLLDQERKKAAQQMILERERKINKRESILHSRVDSDVTEWDDLDPETKQLRKEALEDEERIQNRKVTKLLESGGVASVQSEWLHKIKRIKEKEAKKERKIERELKRITKKQAKDKAKLEELQQRIAEQEESLQQAHMDADELKQQKKDKLALLQAKFDRVKVRHDVLEKTLHKKMQQMAQLSEKSVEQHREKSRDVVDEKRQHKYTHQRLHSATASLAGSTFSRATDASLLDSQTSHTSTDRTHSVTDSSLQGAYLRSHRTRTGSEVDREPIYRSSALLELLDHESGAAMGRRSEFFEMLRDKNRLENLYKKSKRDLQDRRLSELHAYKIGELEAKLMKEERDRLLMQSHKELEKRVKIKTREEREEEAKKKRLEQEEERRQREREKEEALKRKERSVMQKQWEKQEQAIIKVRERELEAKRREEEDRERRTALSKQYIDSKLQKQKERDNEIHEITNNAQKALLEHQKRLAEEKKAREDAELAARLEKEREEMRVKEAERAARAAAELEDRKQRVLAALNAVHHEYSVRKQQRDQQARQHADMLAEEEQRAERIVRENKSRTLQELLNRVQTQRRAEQQMAMIAALEQEHINHANRMKAQADRENAAINAALEEQRAQAARQDMENALEEQRRIEEQLLLQEASKEVQRLREQQTEEAEKEMLQEREQMAKQEQDAEVKRMESQELLIEREKKAKMELERMLRKDAFLRYARAKNGNQVPLGHSKTTPDLRAPIRTGKGNQSTHTLLPVVVPSGSRPTSQPSGGVNVSPPRSPYSSSFAHQKSGPLIRTPAAGLQTGHLQPLVPPAAPTVIPPLNPHDKRYSGTNQFDKDTPPLMLAAAGTLTPMRAPNGGKRTRSPSRTHAANRERSPSPNSRLNIWIAGVKKAQGDSTQSQPHTVTVQPATMATQSQPLNADPVSDTQTSSLSATATSDELVGADTTSTLLVPGSAPAPASTGHRSTHSKPSTPRERAVMASLDGMSASAPSTPTGKRPSHHLSSAAHTVSNRAVTAFSQGQSLAGVQVHPAGAHVDSERRAQEPPLVPEEDTEQERYSKQYLHQMRVVDRERNVLLEQVPPGPIQPTPQQDFNNRLRAHSFPDEKESEYFAYRTPNRHDPTGKGTRSQHKESPRSSLQKYLAAQSMSQPHSQSALSHDFKDNSTLPSLTNKTTSPTLKKNSSAAKIPKALPPASPIRSMHASQSVPALLGKSFRDRANTMPNMHDEPAWDGDHGEQTTAQRLPQFSTVEEMTAAFLKTAAIKNPRALKPSHTHHIAHPVANAGAPSDPSSVPAAVGSPVPAQTLSSSSPPLPALLAPSTSTLNLRPSVLSSAHSGQGISHVLRAAALPGTLGAAALDKAAVVPQSGLAGTPVRVFSSTQKQLLKQQQYKTNSGSKKPADALNNIAAVNPNNLPTPWNSSALNDSVSSIAPTTLFPAVVPVSVQAVSATATVPGDSAVQPIVNMKESIRVLDRFTPVPVKRAVA